MTDLSNPFYFKNFPSREFSRLTHFGSCQPGQHLTPPMHWHPGWEVFLITSGRGGLSLGGPGGDFQVSPGDLVVIAPEVPHLLQVKFAAGYKWFGFQTGSKVGYGLESTLAPRSLMGRAPPLTFVDEIDADLDALAPDFQMARWRLLSDCYSLLPVFNGIQEELDHPQKYSRELIYLRALEILSVIARRLDPESKKVVPNQIRRVCALIQADPGFPFSLQGLAEAAGWHQGHLSRRFKAATGSSLVGYINDRRLEKAKELRATGFTISAAATRCGFEEPGYFSQLFKRKWGLSPSGWLVEKRKREG